MFFGELAGGLGECDAFFEGLSTDKGFVRPLQKRTRPP